MELLKSMGFSDKVCRARCRGRVVRCFGKFDSAFTRSEGKGMSFACNDPPQGRARRGRRGGGSPQDVMGLQRSFSLFDSFSTSISTTDRTRGRSRTRRPRDDIPTPPRYDLFDETILAHITT